MTATIYTRADKDELVVDVTGADPGSAQTAQLALWSGRSPQALASGKIATLGETWVDNTQSGASGDTFGSLGAITAAWAGRQRERRRLQDRQGLVHAQLRRQFPGRRRRPALDRR